MNKAITLGIVLGILSGAAHAAPAKRRPSAAPAAASAKSAPMPGWSYEEEKDPITDAKRGFATLGGDATGALVVKCDKNGPDSIYMTIIPATPYVGPSVGSRRVQIRIDDGAVRDDTWMYLRDQIVKASSRPEGPADPYAGAPVTELAPQFAAAHKIALRFVDYTGTPVDIVLTSSGDASVVRRVFATCGDSWPAP